MAVDFKSGDGGPDDRNSATSASRNGEAIDVARGECEVAYGDTGLVYSLRVEGSQVRLVPPITRDLDDPIRRLEQYSETLGLALDPAAHDVPIDPARELAPTVPRPPGSR